MALSVRIPTVPYVKPGSLVFDGDSITVGYQLPPTLGYADQSAKALAALYLAFVYTNSGFPGARTDQLLATVGADVDAHLVAGGRFQWQWTWGNLAILESGINDLYQSQSSATVIANQSTWLAGRRAAGYKAGLLTIPPCNTAGTPGSYATEAAAVRTYFLAHPELYDVICDVAAFPHAMNTADPLYFQADQVHWTPLLSLEVAQQVVVPAIMAAMEPA